MSPRVLIVVADGTEEIEATVAIDVLRRAGADVVVAGLAGAVPVTCSRSVRLLPDQSLAEAQAGGPYDAIVLPGGAEGSQRFAESAELGVLIRDQLAAGRILGAICAAPIALVAHRVGAGRRQTSHPSVRERVESHTGAGGYITDQAVVEDGALLTSRGPGTAFEFAFALVEKLFDRQRAADVRAPMGFE